jgi:integrase
MRQKTDPSNRSFSGHVRQLPQRHCHHCSEEELLRSGSLTFALAADRQKVRRTSARILAGERPGLHRGVSPKEVAKILGHADVATLLNTYAHALPSDRKAALEAIGKAFG